MEQYKWNNLPSFSEYRGNLQNVSMVDCCNDQYGNFFANWVTPFDENELIKSIDADADTMHNNENLLVYLSLKQNMTWIHGAEKPALLLCEYAVIDSKIFKPKL